MFVCVCVLLPPVRSVALLLSSPLLSDLCSLFSSPLLSSQVYGVSPPLLSCLCSHSSSPLLSGLCSLSSCVPRQFHVVKEEKNWTEAQRYCRDEFTDLATIDNMTEMKMLNSTMNEAGAADAWIGLKQGSIPKWQWSLADRDFYREDRKECMEWDQSEETNENCTVLKGNGKWCSKKCDKEKTFICYDGEKPSYSLTLEYRQLNYASKQISWL